MENVNPQEELEKAGLEIVENHEKPVEHPEAIPATNENFEDQPEQVNLTNEISTDLKEDNGDQTAPAEQETVDMAVEQPEQEPKAEAEPTAQPELATVHEDFIDEPEQVNLTYEISADPEEDAIDYSTMSKHDLVDLAVKVAEQEDLKEAGEVMRNIRPLLENIFAEEYNTALATFIEEGNDKADFEYKGDGLKEKFYEAAKTIQRRKTQQHERSEQEKIKNLEAKRTILEKLKHLTESDETENSLEQVKELQREWKKIRVVPQEFVQELWESYRFYLDKFYDNVSINNELKELDRKKNLEIKIELCKKVGELQEEKSIKKALILLNKYHEEWKNAGPVPKEFSDEIWKRFKEASDQVYEQKKTEINKLQEVRKQNLELKTAINERLELLVATHPEKPKEWIEKTKQVNDLFDEWRKIGKVPREQNEAIWGRFRDLRNGFFNDKNAFFRKLNAEKNENLAQKTAICEKAEAMKDSSDWQSTANQLKKLQEDWRKIGPVPDKVSDAIWKRFRAACDDFFNRKEGHFKGQKEEQQANLDKKNELLTKLEELVNMAETETESAFAQARQIQKEWGEIGFVPFDSKKNIQTRFTEAMDKLYKKLKRNPEEMSEVRLKEHYEEIANMPDAQNRLKNEERRIREKIKFLRGDIETLENNVGFFRQGNTKASNPFVKQIEEKINKANGQLSRLERELKVIRSLG